MDKIVKRLVALVMSLSMTLSVLPSGIWSAYAVDVPAANDGSGASVSVSASTGASEVTLEGDYTTADVKAELRRIILLEDDTVVNVSKYGVPASDMDILVAEVLEENYLTSFVTVTCAVNSDGIATHLVIQRSEALSLAKDEMSELSENAPATANPDAGVAAVDGEGEGGGGGEATGLTEDEMQELLSLYALYLQTYVDYPQYLGVLDPYFYTKNTDTSPMGAMLVVAGIPQEAIDYGQVSYNDLFGCIMTFYLGNMATVQFYGNAITSAKDEALTAVKNSGAVTYIDRLLVLTDWLANHANFDMPYIMNQSQKDEEGNNIEMMIAEDGTIPNEYLSSGELKNFCENILHEIFKQGALQDGKDEGYKVYYAEYVKNNYGDVFDQVANAPYPEDETKTVRGYIYDQVYNQVMSAAMEQGASEEQAKAQAEHIAGIEADYQVALQVVDMLDSQTPATTAAATLTVILVDAEGKEIGRTDIVSPEEGTAEESYTFQDKEIRTAAAGVLPEGYELTEGKTYEATVAYGETQTLNVEVKAVESGSGGDTPVQPETPETGTDTPDPDTTPDTTPETTPETTPDTDGEGDNGNTPATPDESVTPENESQEPSSQPTPAADQDASVMPIAEAAADEETSAEGGDSEEEQKMGPVATAADEYASDPQRLDPYADAYADNYADQMDAPFAEALAPQVAGSWTGNLVGALCLDSCVCKSYTYAFNFIIQWMNPGVYGKNGESTDLSVADNWKSADDLYYISEEVKATAEDGTVLVDGDGNEITTSEKTFSTDAGYVVDSVRITYNKSVSMYGEVSKDFTSDHYWSAVKVDGEWYYIDSCYADIYIECMMRSRVETDGYINNLYFMISDASAREMYDGYYDSETGLDTLYDSRNGSGISDDTSYEHTWFSFAKSQVYSDGSGYYYMYDDTDALNELGKKNDQSGSSWDEEDEPTVYQLVYRPMDSSNSAEKGGDSYDVSSDASVKVLVDVNNGTYRDADGNMVESELLKELYSRYLEYAENFPAVFVSMAYDDGIAYLSLGNTILAYDVSAGTLTRVLEYNEVYAVRDKHNAFGGKAFTVTEDADGADLSITNPPIAAINIVGDELTVTLATNYAYISGKDNIEDKSSYGYEFQETNYNPTYVNYSDYGVDLGDYGGQLDGLIEQEDNDNDEFMWSANFVDTVSVSELAGTEHNYEKVTVAPACGIDGYTEYRCSDCGRICVDDEHPQEVAEGTALEHHFIHFEEQYYTKNDGGSYKTGEVYVCADCLHSVNDLSDDEDADNSEWEALESGETASGHVYELVASEDGQITWAEDNSSVTITGGTLVCPTCDGKALDFLVDDTCANITADGEISISVELEEPMTLEATAGESTGTCEEGANTVYTAAGSYNDIPFTVSKSVTQHAYGDPVFYWNDDKSSAEAEFSCTRCDNSESVDCEIRVETTEPTYVKDGATVYYATAKFNNAEYIDTKTVTIAKKVLAAPELGEAVNDNGGVTVTWSTVENATAYQVYRKASGEKSWSKVGTPVTGTSFMDTTAVSGTTYVYTVGGVVEEDGATALGSYDEKGVSVKYIAAPVVTKAANTAKGVTVTWNKVPGAAKYRVYYRSSGTQWSSYKEATGTSYTFGGGTSGKTYTYTVQAVNGSDMSSYDETGVSVVKLSIPTLVKAENTAKGVTVTWEDVPGATKYRVYYSSSGAKWGGKSYKETTGTSYTFTGGTSGKTYTYTVRAVNGSTLSYFDKAGVSVMKLSVPTVALKNTASGISVRWDEIGGAKGYYVYRKTGSGKYSKIATIKSGSTVSYTDTAVKSKNGTAYTYAVRAYNGQTMSYFAGKTMVRLTSNTISSVTNSAKGTMTVKWDQNSSATGYQVYYKTGSTVKTVTVKGNSSLSKTISGLTKGSTYTVYVRSYKTVSDVNYYSAWSSSKTVKISK